MIPLAARYLCAADRSARSSRSASGYQLLVVQTEVPFVFMAFLPSAATRPGTVLAVWLNAQAARRRRTRPAGCMPHKRQAVPNVWASSATTTIKKRTQAGSATRARPYRTSKRPGIDRDLPGGAAQFDAFGAGGEKSAGRQQNLSGTGRVEHVDGQRLIAQAAATTNFWTAIHDPPMVTTQGRSRQLRRLTKPMLPGGTNLRRSTSLIWRSTPGRQNPHPHHPGQRRRRRGRSPRADWPDPRSR